MITWTEPNDMLYRFIIPSKDLYIRYIRVLFRQ